MFNLRFSPEYTAPNDQERSGGIDSSPVREAGSRDRKSVREALTVGPLSLTPPRRVLGRRGRAWGDCDKRLHNHEALPAAEDIDAPCCLLVTVGPVVRLDRLEPHAARYGVLRHCL